MKLYELGTGEPVQVLVKVENASAEYDSTVAFGKEGILLIEPIRVMMEKLLIFPEIRCISV